MNRITVENKENGIAVLTMNKGRVNTMDLDFMEEMCLALEDLEYNSNIRGLIITSALSDYFSFGAALNEFYQVDKERLKIFIRRKQEFNLRLWGCRLTTIALVNGIAQREGFALAMGCDYRIGTSQDLNLTLNYTSTGLLAGSEFNLLQKKLSFETLSRLEFPETLTNNLDFIQTGILHEINTTEPMQRAFDVMNQLLTRPDNIVAKQKLSMIRPALNTIQDTRLEEISDTVARIMKTSTQAHLETYIQKMQISGECIK